MSLLCWWRRRRAKAAMIRTLTEANARFRHDVLNIEHLRVRALDYVQTYRGNPNLKDCYERMADRSAKQKDKVVTDHHVFVTKTIQEFLIAHQ